MATTTTNVRDYSSIYNIKDFMLNQIAPKYFDINDISLLNVGLFGMITDITGTVVEDNLKVTSRYITELLPGKSKLPEFIYANAANYGISDVFATCSRCSAMLLIKESDVLNYGKMNTITGYSEYVIDSDMKVYVEDIPYSIPYNIKIRSNYFNGSYHHHCTYDQSIMNSVCDLSSPYIRCIKTTVTGETQQYLALNVTLFQYIKKRTVENIISNSKLNLPYVDVTFTDDLCNFEILYKASNSSTKTQLKKYLETTPATITPFAYYKLVDDRTLRISFTSDDRYFIPEYNSELEILMYETVGVDGIFTKYTGSDIYTTGSSENTDLSYNNEVPLICVITGDSLGGDSAPTLEELRLLTWEKHLTLDSYTTDEDLNRYFLNYAAIYNSEALFIKTRDDCVSRIFACYTRLKYGDRIFPTNTLDLEVTFDKIGGYDSTDEAYIIPQGTKFIYKDGSDSVCEIAPEGDTSDIAYTSIALISVNKDPNAVTCYMNSINKTATMDYTYVNNDCMYQFIVKLFSMERNAIRGDNQYDIQVVLLPSDLSILSNTVFQDDYSGDAALDEVDDTEIVPVDDGSLQIEKIKVYLYINHGNGCYIQLTYDPDNSSNKNGYSFKTSIITNDLISNDVIELKNMYSCESHQVQTCSSPMNNPPITILSFYDEETPTRTIHGYEALLTGTDGLTLTNTFTPQENQLYFAYPLTLIQSVVDFLPNNDDAGFKMSLSGLPLFSYDFLQDETNIQLALDRINSQHDFLVSSLTKITSNFKIQMKFFNTYGKSRTFTVTDGSLLNRTNCDLSMDVKFVDGVVSEEYIEAIRITCKTYIESLNEATAESTSGINKINISELITLLHNTYDGQISYIIFRSLNGYPSDIQNIFMNKDLSSSENLTAIPEFLTINTEDITITPL